MSTRGQRLLEEAIEQIDALADSLDRGGEAALALPCRGRGKLGDGTVAAVAMHTADNYRRLAGFLGVTTPGAATHQPAGAHGAGHRAVNITLDGLLDRLAAAKDALAVLAGVDDATLDAVPPPADMKFADGERTLEQIVASILKHQRHQVDALTAPPA
jgi:hypothetical protein